MEVSSIITRLCHLQSSEILKHHHTPSSVFLKPDHLLAFLIAKIFWFSFSPSNPVRLSDISPCLR